MFHSLESAKSKSNKQLINIENTPSAMLRSPEGSLKATKAIAYSYNTFAILR